MNRGWRGRRRRPNPRLAKIHRNYTVEEVAGLFGIHRNTVREWVKRGLPTSDGRRPMLLLGRDLVAFLSARRAKNKRTCQPGELYCVRCRAPRAPAGDMVDYVALPLGLFQENEVPALDPFVVGVVHCHGLMLPIPSHCSRCAARARLCVPVPAAS